jgi:hypothetical protein
MATDRGSAILFNVTPPRDILLYVVVEVSNVLGVV